MKRYFVYIVANSNRTIYIGVTNNLMRRVQEHRDCSFLDSLPSTKSQNLSFEEFGDVRDAIKREKELKGYNRSSKIYIIEGKNPQWDDLASD